jgi:sulfotransferase family protein
MKLIGAGLPRTATTTQMIALEQLGLPCYHMRNLMTNMEGHLPLWYDAMAGRGDWEKLFEGCTSAVDWPAAFFYRELMDVYPDAKVLLSVRNHESWERSMRDTIWAIYFGRGLLHHIAQARYQVDPVFRSWYDLMVRMVWVTGAPFAGAYAERQQMVDAAARWDDEVKATVPADRLVVWEPADGWEPICAAVGAPVPDEPLPNVNDTEAFKLGIIGGALESLQGWFAEQGGGSAHGFTDASARHS